MAKRRYGRVSHRKSKRGGEQGLSLSGSRSIDIRVGVARWPYKKTESGHQGLKGGDYAARACMLKKSDGRLARCSDTVSGKTPTKAIKNALTQMAKHWK